MTPNSPGMRLAPVVDIVLPASEEELETIFDRNTRKLIGALHRRFWDRRRRMLQDRATASVEVITPSFSEQGSIEISGEVIADFREHRTDWEARLNAYAALREAMIDPPVNPTAPIVRLRGWDETETGVLVDGRAVPGCIVDVAVALSHAASLFRDGIDALALDIEQVPDAQAATLWRDLIQLAEDRTGVERGTISMGTVSEVEHHQAAVA